MGKSAKITWLSLLLGVAFLYIPLAVSSLWGSVYLLRKYFAFPDSLNFSSFVVYGITCFLVLLPLIVLSVYPIFFKTPIPTKVQKFLTKYIVTCFVLAIFSQIGVKLYFEKAFAEQGYFSCSGTPRSWTAGMATRYVKDMQLCNQ